MAIADGKYVDWIGVGFHDDVLRVIGAHIKGIAAATDFVVEG